jgi:hypothetical protein
MRTIQLDCEIYRALYIQMQFWEQFRFSFSNTYTKAAVSDPIEGIPAETQDDFVR